MSHTDKDMALPTARAGRASTEPASSLGHSATIANAGNLLCRSCPSDWPDEATHIANAYATRDDGGSWDWPLCEAHLPYAMVAGWFPIRKVGEGADFDPKAHLVAPQGGAK